MIDHALQSRLEPFADGRRARNSFAARTGPPISVGIALLVASMPVGYWLQSVAGMLVGGLATIVFLVAGYAVLRLVRSYVIAAIDGELVVLRSRLTLPSHPVSVIKRIPTDEAELVVRTSPWGFAQAHLDGATFEVIARDYTNAHAMGQLYSSDGGSQFAMS